MRFLRAPLVRPVVVATVAGLTLAAAPAEAGTAKYAASYKVKAGARSAASEAAREIADIRKVAVASPTRGELRIAVKADEVPAKASRIDGVYSVEMEFSNGETQTITYSTDTVEVTGGLELTTGLLDLFADAELTLRRGEVETTGEGCDTWEAKANHRSDTVVFEASNCGDLRFVDEIAAEAVAVTTADRQVGFDASGELRHNVHIR